MPAPLETVADLLASHPGAERLLQRHGVDVCCGGKQPLDKALGRAGVTLDAVLTELDAAGPADRAADDRDWTDAPLPDLVDHILARFHRPLEAELPRLVALAQKVNRRHGPKDPPRFAAILETVETLHHELVDHMLKEERILFPLVTTGQGARAEMPIRVMGMEHEEATAHLEGLRELTGGYVVPEAACRSWRALWEGLAELDADLQAHIELEDEVLFPRALSES